MPRIEDFEKGEKWFDENEKHLRAESPGKYLYLNALDLTYVIADTHNEAGKEYSKKVWPYTRGRVAYFRSNTLNYKDSACRPYVIWYLPVSAPN